MHGLRVVLLCATVSILAGCQTSGKYLPPKQQPITIPPPSSAATPSGSSATSSPSLSSSHGTRGSSSLGMSSQGMSSQGMNSRGSAPADRTIIPVKNTPTSSLSLPPVTVNSPNFNKPAEIIPVATQSTAPTFNKPVEMTPINQVIQPVVGQSAANVLPTIDPASIAPPKELTLPSPNMSSVPVSPAIKEVHFEKPPMPE
jgi:hypothetical protein